MLELLKPLTAVALFAVAVNVCLASEAEAKDMIATGGGRFFAASAQMDTMGTQGGFGEIRAAGATALNVTQLNRVLWESSFERGIVHSSSATAVSAVNPISPAGLYRGEGGHQRIGHGNMLVGFSSPFMETGMSEGLTRRPGIGACALAALAITALAIFRRRTSHQPIVPPRPHLEAQVAINGAK